MDTDATSTGASQEEEKDQIVEEKPLSPREQAMARMEENREAQLLKEAGIEPDQTGETAEEQAAAATSAAVEPMHKVKIDGEEIELPLSELVKGYQKNEAASRRLDEATKRLKELDEREAALKETEEQLKKQSINPEDTTGAGAETADEDAEVDAALDAYLEGDTSKIKDILKKAAKGGQDTASPKEEIDRIVQEKLAERETNREHAAAQAQFKKDYADIFGDPDLLAMANKRYYAKLNEGKSITDAMLEAGKDTKAWLHEKTGNRNTDKLRRKENIDNLQVAGARSSAADTEETPENTSSIIAEMRQKRGLAA